MNERFYGSGEVAKQLGVPRWRLVQLIEMGKLPDASAKLEGRRLFSLADVDAITEKYRELCRAKAEKELAKVKLVG